MNWWISLFGIWHLAFGIQAVGVQRPESFAPAVREEVERAQRRAEQEPRNAKAAGELAMLLHAHDQLGMAARWYDRARATEPRSFDWAYGAGLVRLMQGEQQEAIQALQEAVRLEPYSLNARLKLADALFAAADVDASAVVYRRLLADAPRLPQVHYGLGRVQAARGDHATAATHYLRALELFDTYGAARYALALTYRNLGEASNARTQLVEYEKHKMGAPPLPDPFLDRVDALKRGALRSLTAGVALGNSGDIDAAIREHERAIAQDPMLAQGHIHLITLYGRKGDVAAAERHYKAAIALKSHLADAHYNFGVLLLQQNRFAEAADAFRKAIEVDPYYAPAHNNLGQVLEREQRIAEATDHYRTAIEHDPGFRVARFNLGRTLVALNRAADAIDQFLKILEPADEATPTYMYALAAAYVRTGDIATAKRYGVEAQRRAEELGQHELASQIAKDLEKLKP